MRAQSKSSAEHNCSMPNTTGRRPALRTIPKGLGPPAQGWRATPTLGARSEIESTPTALWLRSGARAGMDGPQPRCGWGCLSDDDPRVARASQPWALGRNPVGILERSATLRVAGGLPARRWLDVSAATLHAEMVRLQTGRT